MFCSGQSGHFVVVRLCLVAEKIDRKKRERKWENLASKQKVFQTFTVYFFASIGGSTKMSERNDSQPYTVPQLATPKSSKPPQPLQVTGLAANLNVDPPETDGAIPSTCQHQTSSVFSLLPPFPKVTCNKDTDTSEAEGKRLNKLGKSRSRNCKAECSMDYGADADGYLPGQGVSSSREEKVSSLKTVRTLFNGGFVFASFASFALFFIYLLTWLVGAFCL